MSDLTFSLWFTAAAGSLAVATIFVLWLTAEAPTGRHRAGAPVPVIEYRNSDPAPRHREPVALRAAAPGPDRPADDLVCGPLIRPHIDHAAWRAELDEMQRQYERREALRAVAEGQPDPGYTFPGAHTLAGAVA